MNKVLTIILVSALLIGCGPTKPDAGASMADIHAHVNSLNLPTPLNYPDCYVGNCLPVAEAIYELATANGFDPEIIIIAIREDGRVVSSHAVVAVDGVVYDNDWLAGAPFPRKQLAQYGKRTVDLWSKHRSINIYARDGESQ